MTAVREARTGAALTITDEAPLLTTDPACAETMELAAERTLEDMLLAVDIARMVDEVTVELELELEMLEVLEEEADDEVEETVDEAVRLPIAKSVEP